MNVLHRHIVKHWLAPFLIAVMLFGVVRPTFAQVVQPPPTLAQYLAGGGIVDVGLGLRSEGHLVPQVYYEVQGERVFVTDTNYVNAEPSTDGEYIVWMAQVGGGWQIFMHHMPTGETAQLTFEGNNVHPKISGDYVVWEGWVDDGWQVFLYNGTSVRQIIQGDPSLNVDISNSTVVFNRKNDQGEWSAVSYTIGSPAPQVVKTGIISKFPYFKPDGTIAFRAEEENKLYQTFLTEQRRQQEQTEQREEIEGGEATNPETLEESLGYYGITGCPAVARPVCGEDGVSYVNACVAIWAGTDPSSAGVCEGKFIQEAMPWSDNYQGGGFGLVGILSDQEEPPEERFDGIASGSFDGVEHDDLEEEPSSVEEENDISIDIGSSGSSTIEIEDENEEEIQEAREQQEGVIESNDVFVALVQGGEVDGFAIEENADGDDQPSGVGEEGENLVAEEGDPIEPEVVTEEEIIEELEGLPIFADEIVEGVQNNLPDALNNTAEDIEELELLENADNGGAGGNNQNQLLPDEAPFDGVGFGGEAEGGVNVDGVDNELPSDGGEEPRSFENDPPPALEEQPPPTGDEED